MRAVYLEETRVFKAGFCPNTAAGNNTLGTSWRDASKINRDSWGHSYSAVRGEILGFAEDGLVRKHLPRMFSLIKNES